MVFAVRSTLDAVESHLSAAGDFLNVVVGEPKAPPAGERLTAALFMDSVVVDAMTLTDTVETHSVVVRVYAPALRRSTRDLERDIDMAVTGIESAIYGDFSLGATVRNVDVANVDIGFGHIDVGGVEYRMAEYLIPMIVDGSGTSAGASVDATTPFSIDSTLVSIQGHVIATGYYDDVIIGEPESWGSGNRLNAAVWINAASTPEISLSNVSRAYELRVVSYRNAFTEPQSRTEYMMAEAVQQVSNALIGDYDLGSTIRMVDPAGAYGGNMNTQFGYAPVSDVMYRVADLRVPILVSDTSVLTA